MLHNKINTSVAKIMFAEISLEEKRLFRRQHAGDKTRTYSRQTWL